MPNVGALKIREVSGLSSVVEIKLQLLLGTSKQYRLRYTSAREESGFVFSWEKLPWPELKPSQTIADTSGYWSIRKFEDGGLLAVYHVYTDPGHVPLGLTNIAQGVPEPLLPEAAEAAALRLVIVVLIVAKILTGTLALIFGILAPVRVCDNGGWTDTWFAGLGASSTSASIPAPNPRSPP